MSTDPRVEAAARALANVDGNDYDTMQDELGVIEVRGHDNGYLADTADVLAAADRADREQGIHRVRVDDATVERVAREMCIGTPGWSEDTYAAFPSWWHERARAVLAALTGSES